MTVQPGFSFGQLGFIKNHDAVATQQRCGNSLARDAAARETAIIDFPAATGGATLLQDGDRRAMLLRQREHR